MSQLTRDLLYFGSFVALLFAVGALYASEVGAV